MKRYLAFYGGEFYPFGGMEDFVGDFDTIEQAMDAIKYKHCIDEDRDAKDWDICWAHVYDIQTKENVIEL